MYKYRGEDEELVPKKVQKKQEQDRKKRMKSLRRRKMQCLKRELEALSTGDGLNGKKRYYRYYTITSLFNGEILVVGIVSQDCIDDINKKYVNTKLMMIGMRKNFVKTLRMQRKMVLRSVKRMKLFWRKSENVIRMEIRKKRAMVASAVKRIKFLKRKAMEKKNVLQKKAYIFLCRRRKTEETENW